MEPEAAELATRRLMEAELEAMAHYSYKLRKAEKTEAAAGAEKTRATRHRHFIGSTREACIPVGVSAFPGPSAKERTVEEETKARTTATISGRRPRRTRSWLSLPFFVSSFPRLDGYAPLDELEEGTFRSVLPGRLEQLALDHKLVMDCLELYNSLHPMNQLKPTVSLASLLDGVVDVMVLRITYARHATVALRFHAMAHVKHFPVDMTSRRCYAKCAILCHVCCIHIQENLLMVIAKTNAMSTTEHCFIYLCLAVDRKLTS